MGGWFHGRTATTLIAVVAAAISGGGIAYAAASGLSGSGHTASTHTIYACVARGSGALDLTTANAPCRNGAQKISWNVVGPAGPPGARGAPGETGARGPQGIQGVAGSAGPAGATGAAGVDGTNGTNGVDGTNGINGTNGTNGVDGTTGPTGPSGATGATGPTANITSLQSSVTSLQSSVTSLQTTATSLQNQITDDIAVGRADVSSSSFGSSGSGARIHAGSVTTNSAGAGAVTFTPAFSSTPSCIATPTQAGTVVTMTAPSTTTVTFDAVGIVSLSAVSSEQIDYICIGGN